jgi:hypothetical protein
MLAVTFQITVHAELRQFGFSETMQTGLGRLRRKQKGLGLGIPIPWKSVVSEE